MLDDFIENLFHPVRFLNELKGRDNNPWGLWVLYGAIAVAGTVLFGFSFGLIYDSDGSPWTWAWVLTVAAGCGWLLFIPAVLLLTTGKRRLLAFHSCLMTMVYGEAILEIGTIINLLGYWWGFMSPHTALLFNSTLVAISNLVMASAICAQLKTIEQPSGRVLALWIALLNAAGAITFVVLYRGFLIT